MSIIGKNYFYNIILTLSNVIFPIITFPFASRVLGPDGIGKVQFANSLAQYFVFIAALGIPIYGMREVAKVKDNLFELKKTFTNLFVLNILTSTLMLLFYLLTIFICAQLYVDKIFYLVAGLMLVFSFCNVDWFFSGTEKFKFIAIRSVLVKVVFLLILFVSVRAKGDDIKYLWIVIGASILNNILNIYYLRSFLNLKLFSWTTLKKHLKPLLLIFSTVVAASIYSSLDTIILGFLKGYKDVGYYVSASRINKMVIPFLSSLPLVLVPEMTRAWKEKNDLHFKELLERTFEFVIVIGIPVCFGLIILAPELIYVFAGEEFKPAIFSMQIMAPVVLIISLGTVWVLQVLTPAEKDFQASISVFFGLGVSLILNFLLIPRYSYLGATISNLLSEFVVVSGFAYFSSKIIKLRFNYTNVFKAVTLSVMFIPILQLIRYILKDNYFLICISSILICGLFYFIVQIFILKHDLLNSSYLKIRKYLLDE